MAAPSQEYLKTKVMTALPEMLTLMLWDGAIRFAEQGKEAIIKKDIEGSYKALLRSQKIVMELNGSLKHSVNPELCAKLASLYNFIYRRLVDANLKKEAALVDDALEIMRLQRETWVMLMDKLVQEKAAGAQANEVDAGVPGIPPARPDAAQIARPGQAAAAAPEHAGKAPAASPARRSYPAFAVRPAAAPAVLSVQG